MSLMGQRIYARLRMSWAQETDSARKAHTERRMQEIALQYKLQVDECALQTCSKPIIAGQTVWMSGEDRYCGPRCWMHDMRAKARGGGSVGVDRKPHRLGVTSQGPSTRSHP